MLLEKPAAAAASIKCAGLRKGTFLQRSEAGHVFKGLGVSKRYCKTNYD